MRKYLLSIIVLLIAIIPFTFARAASIDQIIVYQDFRDIIVKGQTSDDVYAVNIEVYDEDEIEFIKKLTVYVSDDNTFKTTIDVENGRYTLRIANYDGGDYEKVSFIKEDPAPGSVPETSDNIGKYIVIGLVSLTALSANLLIRKRLN